MDRTDFTNALKVILEIDQEQNGPEEDCAEEDEKGAEHTTLNGSTQGEADDGLIDQQSQSHADIMQPVTSQHEHNVPEQINPAIQRKRKVPTPKVEKSKSTPKDEKPMSKVGKSKSTPKVEKSKSKVEKSKSTPNTASAKKNTGKRTPKQVKSDTTAKECGYSSTIENSQNSCNCDDKFNDLLHPEDDYSIFTPNRLKHKLQSVCFKRTLQPGGSSTPVVKKLKLKPASAGSMSSTKLAKVEFNQRPVSSTMASPSSLPSSPYKTVSHVLPSTISKSQSISPQKPSKITATSVIKKDKTPKPRKLSGRKGKRSKVKQIEKICVSDNVSTDDVCTSNCNMYTCDVCQYYTSVYTAYTFHQKEHNSEARITGSPLKEGK